MTAEPSRAFDGSVASSDSWVLRGALVHVAAGALPRPASIAVRGDRIAFVGAEEELGRVAGSVPRVIDAGGLHVYPGFTDAHGHLHSLGRHLEEIDLAGARSLEEVLQRVRARADSLPRDAWVSGRGWGTDEWQDVGLPTAAALDAVAGGRPVALWRRDGHSVWVSSHVMRSAGIGRDTRSPDGGRLERHGDGAPSGVFVDNAITLLEGHLPASDATAIRRRLLAAQESCARAGITGVHDMATDYETLHALRALESDGALALRVYVALDDHDPRLRDEPASHASGGVASLLCVRAVKLFSDGALGSSGAWLAAPYADDPDHRGLCLIPPAELRERLRRIVAAGLQPCVHAIGDAANHAVLDAIEDVLGPHHSSRPRIEHAQIVAPEDRPRLGALGIIASMQPIHCTADRDWAKRRLGPLRERLAYSWRSLQDAGARLAFGSDFPVESHDPRAGLFAAVTRRRPGDPVAESWGANERLRLDEAIAAYTEGAAYARVAEHDLGAIEAGRLADLTVFDRELSGSDPESLLEATVQATIVGGRLAFAADRARWEGARS